MKLSGRFSTMALTDLLQWLGMAQKTGSLKVRRGSVCKTLYLHEGKVVGSISDDPNEMIGQFLLARGSISEEQLRQGLRAQETSRLFLGKILVSCGILSEEDMKTALALKTEETVYSLFEWEDASFEFRDGDAPGEHMVAVSLKTEDIVLRGIARYDETKRIRDIFPDGHVVLSRTSRELPGEVQEHPLARRIMERVDGARTIDAIALDVHASPYQVKKFLFEAHRVGLVVKAEREARPPAKSPQVAPPPAPCAAEAADATPPSGDAPAAPVVVTGGDQSPAAAPPAPPAAPPPGATDEGVASLVRQAKRLADDGEFDAALTLLHEALSSDSTSSDARGLQPRIENAFIEQTYRLELPPEAIPELSRPLEELTATNLQPEEFYLVSRIDGLWDLKSIIDIAPMREVDALRVLKRLYRTGAIRLRAAEEREASRR
jgi:hypothetical protein